MTSKPFWASKSLWVNIVAGAGAISTAFWDTGLDAETQIAVVGGIMAVVNIILRLVTKTAVTG